ncbi:AMP-binding protein [Rhodococcus sp. JS3073]|uniref:AMP-binding protein n=1 Tax=Rhodococcus sp. JS3073 TaxID=3002901 RepID=UPI0022853ED1|nr:AMP-binding protein [Rhodococcus sp. JS3073]WAM19617.1 AMP-binding protein [Rhodococcus sp. JS3073]
METVTHLWPATTATARHLPLDVLATDVLSEESLPRAWRARWLENPRAVVARTEDGSQIRADELEERSAAVAARLAAAGLVAGDRLILSSGASIDMLVAYVAAQRMSLVVVPVNTAYGATEIRHIVQNTTPRAAIVDDKRRGQLVSEASTGPIVITGCDVRLPASGGVPTLDVADRDTPALICHTSGTTGAPKGAVLTSGNLLASAEAVRLAWRWSPEDRLILALPLFHLHGLGMGINGSLVSGASMELIPRFSPEAVADAAQAGGTMFFGVPTMYHRLANGPRLSALRGLRLCVSGSAPLAAQLHAQIESGCGQRVLERYGMTETVITISNPYDGERKPGTVGIPLPGVEARLATDGLGGAGEIQLRGPSVFGGYLNNPTATAESFTDDGWFRTGDLGEFDAEGYLAIVGRSKELIISGGYNVYPREVEEVIGRHPAVVEAAVAGRPSEEWGESVVAFVVADGLSSDEVIKWATERLAPYKRPTEVRFVDVLPRNDLGKIRRDQLLP